MTTSTYVTAWEYQFEAHDADRPKQAFYAADEGQAHAAATPDQPAHSTTSLCGRTVRVDADPIPWPPNAAKLDTDNTSLCRDCEAAAR